MGLAITAPHVDRPESPAKALVADRRLYLAADERSLVEHGSATARFLLAAAGRPIPAHVARRLGLVLVEGRIVQQATDSAMKSAAPDADKQSAPEGDKMATPQGDKSATPGGKRERR